MAATAVQVMQVELLIVVAIIFTLLMFLSREGIQGLTTSAISMVIWYAVSWLWVIQNSDAIVHFTWVFFLIGTICMLMVWQNTFSLFEEAGTMKKDPYGE